MKGAFAGEVAVVTGGAGGIGTAVARALAEGGARVAVCDLDGDAAAALAAELGPQHTGHAVDVRSSAAIDAVAAAVAEELGTPSVLFNGAGITSSTPSAEMEDAEWELVIDVNLSGTFRASRALGRRMIAAERGAIINVASLVGWHTGGRGRAPYGASKAGVVGLTRVLAEEWAAHGVRVNAVAPGLIVTPLTQSQIDAGRLDPSDFIARTPVGRAGSVDDLLGTILLLAQPDDAFLTGQTITVDGAMSIAGPRSAGGQA